MAKVLPLAITMMAGPQIISSIIFVTSDKGPVKVSLAYVSAVAVAATTGILIAFGLAHLLGNAVDLNNDSGESTVGKVIEIALVGLLIVFAVKSYLGRETAEPPKWIGALQEAGPKRAFTLGVTLILVMPSDFVVMLTTGVHLVGNGLSFVSALPLIGLTTLIAALPLIAFLLFRKRAESTMPKVRDWMNSHSWLINIFVAALFIVLIVS
ncbi:MAG: GAP family protein [Actinomycetota bacterium]